MRGNTSHRPEVIIEQAMVAIRRRQSRRALGRQAERDHAPAVSIAVTEVLDIVEHNGDLGRQTTVTDLGRTLGIDQPRASKLAGQAIAAGLLRREADQQDGRRSPLQLTAGGRAYLDQVHHYRRTQFARAISGWTDQERQAFAHLLTRFVTALDQPGTGRQAPDPSKLRIRAPARNADPAQQGRPPSSHRTWPRSGVDTSANRR